MPTTIQRTDGTTKLSYSVTETAAELRKALKAAFPTITFSVKSRKYLMDASIDIAWTDGPTTRMVDRVAQPFAGASFDGMTDLKSHHTSEYQGQVVDFGADYVFTSRTESRQLLQAAAKRIGQRYGITDMPAIVLDAWGSPRVDGQHPLASSHQYGGNFDLTDQIYQESRQLFMVNGLVMRQKP